MDKVCEVVEFSVGVTLRVLVIVSHGLLLADRERLATVTVLLNDLLRVDENEFVMLAVRDRDADREGVFRSVEVSVKLAFVEKEGPQFAW
jgi:hypothetical protein